MAGAKVWRDGDVLRVTWTLSEAPQDTTGTVLYSLTVTPKDGSGTKQFGVKYQDGKQVGYFVFDSATAKQQNVEGVANFNDSDLMGSFPAPGLPRDFRYTVVGTLNGDDIERCPDAAGTTTPYDGP